MRLGRIAQQRLHFGRPEVARIDPHDHVARRQARLLAFHLVDHPHLVDAFALEAHRHAQFARGCLDELAHAVLLPGGDHEVFRRVLLQHHPLHLDVISRVTPVAQRGQIAEVHVVLQPYRNAGNGARDLARHEGLAAHRRFVVEENPVARIHAVRFAIIDGDPVRVQLCHRIRAARIERRGFLLRHFLHESVELGGRGLIEAGFLLESENAHRLENPQRAEAVRIRGVFGLLERHGHVALRGEVVDLVGLHTLDDAHDAGGIGQIPVMQEEMPVGHVRIATQMIDPIGVEQRGAPFDAVHVVALGQQQVRQV